jgi:hypothetical protein
MADLNVKDLLRQGSAAARVGDARAARRHFERAIAFDSSNVEAWLGLCGVMESREEKSDCFRRVLALDPGNEEAQTALELLRQAEERERPVPVAPIVEPEVMYCANHPDVETVLRCNRCGKPICTRCAIRTPVGYRCPQCVHQQQAIYFNATSLDYPIAGVLMLVMSTITGVVVPFVVGMIGFFGWIIMIFAAPAVAGLLAEAVRLAVGRRRGRHLGKVVTAAAAVGTIIALLVLWFALPFRNIIVAGIYAFLLLSTIYARLR